MSVVQNTRVVVGPAVQHELLALVSHQQVAITQRSSPQPNTEEVDVYWHEKYNRFLWFQFSPRQLAALYNERYPLQDLLQLEQNGMVFSPSVPERTPGTAITNDGRAWVDFSARSIHQMASATVVMPWSWRPAATENPKRRNPPSCARWHTRLCVRHVKLWRMLPGLKRIFQPGWHRL